VIVGQFSANVIRQSTEQGVDITGRYRSGRSCDLSELNLDFNHLI
jgi:hypothetical protein